MKVLLSIKPKFAEKIFKGTKIFEYRKTIFKSDDIRTIVVYASHPVCKVIGEFQIDTILSTEPSLLWEQTKYGSGISKDFFDEYFAVKDVGYAIKIKSTTEYEVPLSLQKHLGIASPPQSFMYI